MAYIDFTLSKVRESFDLSIVDRADLFADVPTLDCSDILSLSLQENLPLATASNTEKARSKLACTTLKL